MHCGLTKILSENFIYWLQSKDSEMFVKENLEALVYGLLSGMYNNTCMFTKLYSPYILDMLSKSKDQVLRISAALYVCPLPC